MIKSLLSNLPKELNNFLVFVVPRLPLDRRRSAELALMLTMAHMVTYGMADRRPFCKNTFNKIQMGILVKLCL
jgi:hypothetical protein